MNQYFAACPRGVEPVTAAELFLLGATEIVEDAGGVHFEGDENLLYRANLCLRTASRVDLFLREFSAATPEMLHDQIRRLKWEKLIPQDRTFAVKAQVSEGRSGPEWVRHTGYAALKVKDAVVDRFKYLGMERPDVDKDNPDVPIIATFVANRCTLALDSSGTALHERGYRISGGVAPLKETLAAALVDLSGWDCVAPLVDPMCGSGTIAIEAALKAKGIAPGLKRQRFPFMTWEGFEKSSWGTIVSELKEKESGNIRPVVFASDSDPEALELAKKNAKSAGVSDAIEFSLRPFEELKPIWEKPGIILTNPPYGKRLSTGGDPHEFYKKIGDTLKHQMKGWTAFIFIGNLEAAKMIGLRTSKRIQLNNGPVECRLLKYELF